MKTKIKTIGFYAFSIAILAVPVFAGAQFSSTVGGTGELPTSTVIDIIMAIMQWLLFAVGFIAVIAFAIAGILFLTSAGDEDRIGQAKAAMTYSVVGVIVAIAGLVAIRFAANLLGGSNRF